MTLQEIVEQLESCNYECEAGTLENNVAWRELKQIIAYAERISSEAGYATEEELGAYLAQLIGLD
jgi:hypothetical protein